MPSTINASNSGSGGIVQTADASGVLQLQTAGTTALTIDTSQNVSVTNGTANGVTYLNGSKVVTSGSALTFDGTNLGLGVTPSAWVSSNKALQVGTAFIQADGSGLGNVGFGRNAYQASGGWVYRANGYANMLNIETDGVYKFFSAPSGTAGNAITFTQAMTLDASGNLLVGATSAAGNSKGYFFANADTSHTVRITNASSGSSAYANLVVSNDAGNVVEMGMQSSNRSTTYPANEAWMYTSNGINIGYAGNVKFYTGGTERVRIDNSGNFMVGTTSAVSSAKVTIQSNSSSSTDASYLTLYGTAENIGDINYTNAFGIMARLRGTKAGAGGLADEGYFEVKTAVNGTLTGGVYVTSGGTAWVAVSDERKKENLVPITNAITKVLSLRSVTGNYIDDTYKKPKAFLIAQDVLAVLPEAVDTSDPEKMGLAYTDTIPLLVAAIKEQQALIESLTQRITALEGA